MFSYHVVIPDGQITHQSPEATQKGGIEGSQVRQDGHGSDASRSTFQKDGAEEKGNEREGQKERRTSAAGANPAMGTPLSCCSLADRLISSDGINI